MPVPQVTAAKVSFLSDRTCCVCRKPEKPIQIHHIDGNKKNHNIENLCILCLDCHTKTQITGGFGRKLNSDEIILFREDWYKKVAQARAYTDQTLMKADSDLYLKKMMIQIDILKERGLLDLVSMYYDAIGNSILRNKYTDLAIKKGVGDETLILLRYSQKRPDLIPGEVSKRLISRQEKNEDWSQLARTYLHINNLEKSIEYYCKSIVESINEKNFFSAAFYLKELSKEQLYIPLFESEYDQRKKKKDLWWEIRCLEELGWKDQLRETLINNRKSIESSGKLTLKDKLYQVLEDEEKLMKNSEQIANGINISTVKGKLKKGK